MEEEDQSDEWKIQIVREAISQDWRWLAAKKLTLEQRKAVREHLEMNVAALRELTERSRLTKRKARLAQMSEGSESR